MYIFCKRNKRTTTHKSADRNISHRQILINLMRALALQFFPCTFYHIGRQVAQLRCAYNCTPYMTYIWYMYVGVEVCIVDNADHVVR